MTKRKFTTEFKIQALELGSYTEAARQLGIRDSALHNWKKKFKISLNSKTKPVADSVADAEEIKRLKREKKN